MTDEKPKQPRGFAVMDPEKRREIASKGGASVPAHKRSFSKDGELARGAGKKGGQISRGGRGFAAMSPELHKELSSRGGQGGDPEARAFAKTPGLASEAGRKGNKKKPRRHFPPGTFL